MSFIDQLKEIQDKFDKLKKERDKRVFIYWGSMQEFTKLLEINGVTKIDANPTNLFNMLGLECIELIPMRCVLIGDRRDISKLLDDLSLERR